MTAARLSPRGLAAGTAACIIWGLFPVYLHPLRSVPALQVIAHRVTWSCLFLVAWLLLRGQLGGLAVTIARPALLARLGLTALLISVNWLVYVWSVNHNHVVDASLGYYINPLVNVLLGVIVLHEHLNRAQWTAIGLAALAVLYLGLLAGRPPWIAGALAVSFRSTDSCAKSSASMHSQASRSRRCCSCRWRSAISPGASGLAAEH